MSRIEDLTGKKYGRLTVIRRAENDKYNHKRYLCKCECGNEVLVAPHELVHGRTVSCGCYQRQIVSQCASTHRMSDTRIYRVWASMRARCKNKSNRDYRFYGGKGIKICEEWNEFQNFYNWAIESGYTDELTIDRIDYNGNYEPSNCRWATREVQANNTSRNRYLTLNGKTMSMADWAKSLSIPYRTLQWRLGNGWSEERTLATPRRIYNETT